MIETAPLKEIAGALKIHPRSLLRALTGTPNPNYVGHNPDIDLVEVAIAYNVELDRLISIIKGYDELMTKKEAMAHISFLQNKEIDRNLFWLRGYPALIVGPHKAQNRLLRFSKRDIVEYHADNII